MKRITFVTSILLLIALLTLGATAFADGEDTPLEIQVSPHTLNLASNGGSFSIHADVNYNAVADATLTANGKNLTVDHTGASSEDDPPPVCDTFADDRGDLVVKCDLDKVKDMVAAEDDATFELEVTLTDELTTVLTGEETIDIVDHGQDDGGNGGHGDGECDCDGDGQGDCEDNGGDNRGPGGKR